jgi:RimJ/RimL family protein N-acetyltransferase
MAVIFYQGQTSTSKEVILRFPQLSDAPEIQTYINTLSLEQTFIRFQGEQLTLEQEEDWIKGILDKFEKKTGITLFAVVENQIAGVCDINMRGLVESHIGLFGLTINKNFRNEKIGQLLTEKILELATSLMPQMKIVTLSVFANNPAAIHVYKKFGFVEYGNLPEGILHRGIYVDHLYMYKKVK